ncbi:MAG: chromate transporter [Lachnospiraceae bacterium]|nr:chromate transporter [Lachnospiraceae bacterium]
MLLLLELFGTFARIGLFTFGGGYAMLSLIEHVCVGDKHWISYDEMMEIAVVAESTPGSIAINCATYVGYKLKKLPGAIIATIGMILPSFVIIFVISKFFTNFLEIRWVANAFRGIQVAVGILIVDAAIRMLRKLGKRPLSVGIVIGSALALLSIELFGLPISAMLILLAAAIVGITTTLVHERRTQG